jgi:hypothetical protein
MLLVLTASQLNAKVFRVNNTLPADVAHGLYASVKAAHDDSNVMAGDTLMIEGTITTHPDIELTKPLVLVGPGYLLTSNPGTQANASQAIMSQITLKPGAAGTVLIGLTFSANVSSDAPYINCNNVIVMRCYLPNTLYMTGDLQNIQIIQNYFLTATVSYQNSADRFSNVSLKNNIISGGINISSTASNPRVFSTIEHNVFLGSLSLTAETFTHNIVSFNGTSIAVNSANIQYNLYRNEANVPPGTGNQTYDADNLFVGTAGNSVDGQYKIKQDSPYKNAGMNGREPGIFGGSAPYVLSGIPPFPTIYSIEADGVASKQTGLPVRLKIKSNQ